MKRRTAPVPTRANLMDNTLRGTFYGLMEWCSRHDGFVEVFISALAMLSACSCALVVEPRTMMVP